MSRKYFCNRNGSTAILMAVIVVFIILMISLSISRIVNNGLQMGVTQTFSVKAFFASEAGVEKYLWDLRKNNLDIVPLSCAANNYFCLSATSSVVSCVVSTSSCGSLAYRKVMDNGSSYMLRYNENTSIRPTTTIISSFGDYKGSMRVTEIEY